MRKFFYVQIGDFSPKRVTVEVERGEIALEVGRYRPYSPLPDYGGLLTYVQSWVGGEKNFSRVGDLEEIVWDCHETNEEAIAEFISDKLKLPVFVIRPTESADRESLAEAFKRLMENDK